ncbi:hypothetical protein XELAEV_18009548mg [Xenopus laevis]|uniref:Neurotransmitter-gated ion-channel ligand-binding domain-containing protein n=1 Tax=Xenopus laevis TaxID=8355 RepID=A0A974I0I8_XENLA|nr:hypothetical protein XELAEV_18009548mg [Xenopus laevis]
MTVLSVLLLGSLQCDTEEKLFQKLLARYNHHIRPVENMSDPLMVHFEVAITQLVNVDEVNQILETNLWLCHWNPKEYDGIEFMCIPADKIWKPDIVLYNNAVGDFQVEGKPKALVKYNGLITWSPPAIFRSSCPIYITFLSFDHQNCSMKFGPWSYDKAKIYLAIIGSKVDMKDFWENSEWEILSESAPKYNCCEEIYTDITYSFYIRRLPMFYTVNLIMPCLFISFLTSSGLLPSIRLWGKGYLVHLCYAFLNCVFVGHNLPKLLMMKKTVEKKNRPCSKRNRKKSCEKSHALVNTESAEYTSELTEVVESIQFMAENIKDQNERVFRLKD